MTDRSVLGEVMGLRAELRTRVNFENIHIIHGAVVCKEASKAKFGFRRAGTFLMLPYIRRRIVVPHQSFCLEKAPPCSLTNIGLWVVKRADLYPVQQGAAEQINVETLSHGLDLSKALRRLKVEIARAAQDRDKTAMTNLYAHPTIGEHATPRSARVRKLASRALGLCGLI